MSNSAFKTLKKAAPKYTQSNATKNAYKEVSKLSSDKSGWGKSIAGNLKKYTKMGDFDPNKSAYYQGAYGALRQVYLNRGREDMQNNIAAAAANTGGFGNSYGTTAGAQAYQARVQELAAKVPSLYEAASGEFSNQKNNLATLIGMQQQQQQTAINNAQFKVNAQQALDEQRYASAVARDNALRELAKMKLQYANK